MDILCGHCSGYHDTVEGVKLCVSEHPVLTAEPPVEGTGEGLQDGSHDSTPFHCGVKMLPIVWGLPGVGAYEAQERGELIVGGSCRVDDWNPRWQCPVCDHRDGTDRWLASIAEREIAYSNTPDPPWWTKIRMWVQYWLTGDV